MYDIETLRRASALVRLGDGWRRASDAMPIDATHYQLRTMREMSGKDQTAWVFAQNERSEYIAVIFDQSDVSCDAGLGVYTIAPSGLEQNPVRYQQTIDSQRIEFMRMWE